MPSPSAPADLRRETIRLQKRLVQSVKAEIKGLMGGAGPEAEAYYEEYRRDLKGFERIATKRELVERALASDIVVNGDYHALPQSQKVPLRMLEALREAGRPVTLAVEAVEAARQRDLDAFVSGAVGEEEFLRSVDYDRSWGFPWAAYRPLFRFARDHGLRMLALNTHPPGGSPAERDLAAARLLAREVQARPGSLLYAVVGDLHIAQAHLPQRLREALAPSGRRPGILTVYLNSETLYWDLAGKGPGPVPDCLRLDASRYCVMNAPPLLKYQAYLHWAEGQRELPHRGPAAWEEGGSPPPALAEDLRGLAAEIASTLGLGAGGLDRLEVLTAADVDLLGRLRRDAAFTPAELGEMETQLTRREPAFVERDDLVVLASLSLAHAAEEAAHLLHARSAGARPAADGGFYPQVLREALGFLGSRIVVPRRHCYEEADFRDYLEQVSGLADLPPREAELKAVSERVLAHLEAERAGGVPAGDPAAGQPSGVRIGLVHALGYRLGGRLHAALARGGLDRAELRALFRDPLADPAAARASYLALAGRLGEGTGC